MVELPQLSGTKMFLLGVLGHGLYGGIRVKGFAGIGDKTV